MLEAKGHRGNLDHLGDLAEVSLYDNDRQVREVRYQHIHSGPERYSVRLWSLG